VILEQRWSALHHGIDPARVPLLLPWLRVMWVLARPLHRVPPIAITVLGVLLAADAVLLAHPVPGAAAVAVLLAAVCDALDGAVAVVADRATPFGARADALADRLADLVFAAVLWRCGVPWPVALACGVLAVAVDGVRRVRQVPARITVAERPTWTVCAVLACASTAVAAAGWPSLACAAVWLAAGVAGLAQVAVASRG
jgi:CDP-diacylglycerol--glycerol-3-phosphate 3-phosphatidyltransferase